MSSQTPKRYRTAEIAGAGEDWLAHARRVVDVLLFEGRQWARMPADQEQAHRVIDTVHKMWRLDDTNHRRHLYWPGIANELASDVRSVALLPRNNMQLSPVALVGYRAVHRNQYVQGDPNKNLDYDQYYARRFPIVDRKGRVTYPADNLQIYNLTRMPQLPTAGEHTNVVDPNSESLRLELVYSGNTQVGAVFWYSHAIMGGDGEPRWIDDDRLSVDAMRGTINSAWTSVDNEGTSRRWESSNEQADQARLEDLMIRFHLDGRGVESPVVAR